MDGKFQMFLFYINGRSEGSPFVDTFAGKKKRGGGPGPDTSGGEGIPGQEKDHQANSCNRPAQASSNISFLLIHIRSLFQSCSSPQILILK